MQLRFNVRGPLLLCSSRRSIALLKEVRHGHPRGCCTQAGRLQSKRISDRAQDACFIVRAVEVGGITGHGLVRQLAPRADHHGFDLTAAALPNRRGSTAGSAPLVVLIKGDDQQAVAPRLKIAARQEWAEFRSSARCRTCRSSSHGRHRSRSAPARKNSAGHGFAKSVANWLQTNQYKWGYRSNSRR